MGSWAAAKTFTNGEVADVRWSNANSHAICERHDREQSRKGECQEFQSSFRPVNSPWGPAQSAEQIAPGIWRVDTERHGGYHLSPERVAAMPDALRCYVPYAARNDCALGWYEEDIDWCIVCLAFPDAFCAGMNAAHRNRALQQARMTCKGAIRDRRVLTWLDHNDDEFDTTVSGPQTRNDRVRIHIARGCQYPVAVALADQDMDGSLA